MRRGVAARPRAESVFFSDFEWYDRRTRVSVMVHGKEVQSLFEAVAECGRVPVSALLENSIITAGEPLQCHEMVQQPHGWSWQVDSEGYLLVKLRQSLVPRGVTPSCAMEMMTMTTSSPRPTKGAGLLQISSSARHSEPRDRAERADAQSCPPP